jgi:hypothetical protein
MLKVKAFSNQKNQIEENSSFAFYKAKLYHNNGGRIFDSRTGKYRYRQLIGRPAIVLNSVGALGSMEGNKYFYVGSKNRDSLNRNLAYYGLIFLEKAGTEITLVAGGANQEWNIKSYRPTADAKALALSCEESWIKKCSDILRVMEGNYKKFTGKSEFKCKVLAWNNCGNANEFKANLKLINEIYIQNQKLLPDADPKKEFEKIGFKDIVLQTADEYYKRKKNHILLILRSLALFKDNERDTNLNIKTLKIQITKALADVSNQVENFEWEYPCILYFLESLINTIQEDETPFEHIEKLIEEKIEVQFKPNFIQFILEECAKFYFFKGHDVFYSDQIIPS